MRRFTQHYLIFLFLFFAFLILFPSRWISWLLTVDFKIPVKLEAFHFGHSQVKIKNFRLYNPKVFQKGTALKAKEILFTLPSSYNPSVVVDRVEFSDVNLFVEYKSETENNWRAITENRNPSKSDKKYLIKKFILKKIQVVVVNDKGKKTYPTLDQVVIENISNESGFPFSKIEKALADAIVRKVFPLVGIKNFIQAPLKIIPKIFPFLNKSSAQEILEPNENNTQPICEPQQPQK